MVVLLCHFHVLQAHWQWLFASVNRIETRTQVLELGPRDGSLLWSGLVWSVLVCSGLVWFGLVWSALTMN